MIEYSELEKELKHLTIDELEQVKNNLEELINRIITDKKNKKVFRVLDFYNLQDKIIEWGWLKGIDDPKSQFLKVVEEFGKIQQATETNEIVDAIGDTLIALIILNDVLQREICDSRIIDTSDTKEEDLYKYINEKGRMGIPGGFERTVNTDVIAELSRLAEYINKMTEDNKEYYIQKSHLHILEIVRYVSYLAEFKGVDFIESLEFAYNNVNK